jgi:hypothetical protein
MTKKAYCPQHPLTTLVCPKCIGKKGGTATRYLRKSNTLLLFSPALPISTFGLLRYLDGRFRPSINWRVGPSR